MLEHEAISQRHPALNRHSLKASRTALSFQGSAYGAVTEATLNHADRPLNESRRGTGRRVRTLVAVAAIVAVATTGCSKVPKAAKPTSDPSGVVIETNQKTGLSRIDFTKAAKSVERLGIRTQPVGSVAGVDGRPGATTVPQAAVLYTAQGETLVYTNPAPLVFVHHPVTVDHVQENTAVLSAGPPEGTPVVTLGAAELTGIEFGVGK